MLFFISDGQQFLQRATELLKPHHSQLIKQNGQQALVAVAPEWLHDVIVLQLQGD
jgi:hypothetical protein